MASSALGSGCLKSTCTDSMRTNIPAVSSRVLKRTKRSLIVPVGGPACSHPPAPTSPSLLGAAWPDEVKHAEREPLSPLR